MREKIKKQMVREIKIFLAICGVLCLIFFRYPIYDIARLLFYETKEMVFPHSPNKKVDDDISKAVYQEMGDSVYYRGKRETVGGVISYRYEFYTEQLGQLEAIQRIANKVIEQEKIQSKINIECEVKFQHNASSVLAFLLNYSDIDLENADYKTLKRCHIWGTDMTDTIYNDPATYKNLSGIVHLEIGEKLWNASKEQGIDWYEYFPELERLEVMLPEE